MKEILARLTDKLCMLRLDQLESLERTVETFLDQLPSTRAHISPDTQYEIEQDVVKELAF
jgi:hypothetical protein